jgi:hypothetical protein
MAPAIWLAFSRMSSGKSSGLRIGGSFRGGTAQAIEATGFKSDYQFVSRANRIAFWHSVSDIA